MESNTVMVITVKHTTKSSVAYSLKPSSSEMLISTPISALKSLGSERAKPVKETSPDASAVIESAITLPIAI